MLSTVMQATFMYCPNPAISHANWLFGATTTVVLNPVSLKPFRNDAQPRAARIRPRVYDRDAATARLTTVAGP